MAKLRDEIKVHVVDSKRTFLYMRYVDPVSGKATERTTGTNRRRDAERTAAKWEAELRDGRYAAPSRITWGDFWQRYETEVLDTKAESTAGKALAVRSVIEQTRPVERLAEIDAAWLSGWQAALRDRGLTDATIDSYVDHLRVGLHWAKEMGMLSTVPKVRRLNRRTGFQGKGRAITGEEFDRLLAAVPKVIKEGRAESWLFYLRGLWWSGLRLAESLELWWDREDRLCVDLTGRRPMLRIPGRLEKGKRDRLLPIAPEFAELLLSVPEDRRTGRVFDPGRCYRTERISTDRAGRLIARIGKAAGVKVWTHPRSGKIKHATAHDLRRSFGFRWAQRIMPAVLMQMMRHHSIAVTMKFYVSQNAEATADAVWQGFAASKGDTSSDTRAETANFPCV